jgi:hypothetical protein
MYAIPCIILYKRAISKNVVKKNDDINSRT